MGETSPVLAACCFAGVVAAAGPLIGTGAGEEDALTTGALLVDVGATIV